MRPAGFQLARRCTLIAVRRPWAVLLLAAVVAALSVLSLRRTTIAGSLHAMLGEGSPASAALGRIVRDYRSTDDLLVLATAPEGADAAAMLGAFAERLRAAIEASPAAGAMCRGVTWRPDPAVRAFVRGVVIPHGLYYLDDDAFAAVVRRLSPAEMAEQFRRNEALVAAGGPAGGAVAEAAMRDPLRLREFAEARLGGGWPPGGGDGLDLSADGRSLLIRVRGVRSADDLEFAKDLTREVSGLAQAVNRDGLDVRLSGGYAIASYTAGSIRADMISSTAWTVALLGVVIAVLYRGVAAPLLIGGTAALGIVAGFGVHALLRPEITPLTAVLGAMLGGLGVDYGSHLLSHYRAARAGGAHARAAAVGVAGRIGGPLLTACLTTVFGFITLVGAEVSMLRDFAVLGSLGLAGCYGAVLVFLPAVLALVPRAGRPGKGPQALGWYAAWAGRHARWMLAASALMFAGACVALACSPGFLPRFESDRTVMHPRPNPPLDASELIAEKFAMGESLLVEVAAGGADGPASAADLVARCHDAERAVRSCPSARVTGVLGVPMLVPDPRTVAGRTAAIAELDPDRVVAGFQAAVAASAFEPAAFEGYAGFLRTLVAPGDPPGLEDVLAEPGLAETLFSGRIAAAATGTAPGATTGPDRTVLVVRLDRHLRDRDDRERTIRELRAALAGVPGATLTGFSVVSYDLERAAREDLPRFVGISLVLVVGWLLLSFRIWRDAAMAMSCVVFAAVGMLGFMAAAGEAFNTVSVISLPLLIGVSIDNGVFLVSCSRRSRSRAEMLEECRASTQAIVACGATTLVGFGTLYWTSTPAIRSFGLVIAVGTAASMWGALGMLMPALLLLKSRSESTPRPEAEAPDAGAAGTTTVASGRPSP